MSVVKQDDRLRLPVSMRPARTLESAFPLIISGLSLLVLTSFVLVQLFGRLDLWVRIVILVPLILSLVCVGLGVRGLFRRVRVDADNVTVVKAFRSERYPLGGVEKVDINLDQSNYFRLWTVRAWRADGRYFVGFATTDRKRSELPGHDKTYDSPPPEAPSTLKKCHLAIRTALHSE